MIQTPPPSRLELMLQSLAEIPSAPDIPAPTTTSKAVVPVSPPDPVPVWTEEQMFSQFRLDMRRAGLIPYEVNEEIGGVRYEGPLVEVRDPVQATAATTCLLVTYAIGTNVWRLYPVFAPVAL